MQVWVEIQRKVLAERVSKRTIIRNHGVGGRTPYERLRQKTSTSK